MTIATTNKPAFDRAMAEAGATVTDWTVTEVFNVRVVKVTFTLGEHEEFATFTGSDAVVRTLLLQWIEHLGRSRSSSTEENDDA